MWKNKTISRRKTLIMKIIVLLSTYNGEKYLREQIDSILSQVGVNLELIIRDDGSNDNTLKIIEEYENKDCRVRHYVGENVGPGKSFFDLVCSAPESDYYAFCDQDDIWDSTKLQIAVDYLKEMDSSIPNLYYSNLRLVDAEGQFLKNAHDKPISEEKKYSALARNVLTGCTAVFNYSAKALLSKHIPNINILHDGWLYLICKIFGNVVYDFQPHISYRQHINNVVGMGQKKKLAFWFGRVKRLLFSDSHPRYDRAVCLLDSFNGMLTKEDNEKIRKIVDYKKSLRSRLALLMDFEICEPTIIGDIRYRILILFGSI